MRSVIVDVKYAMGRTLGDDVRESCRLIHFGTWHQAFDRQIFPITAAVRFAIVEDY